jgi:PAS domain S-box-containing protein
LFAAAWIYFSDRALALLVSDPRQLVQWSSYKGMAFVALTSALLFALMTSSFRSSEKRSAQLQSIWGQLERLNRLYAALSHINQAVASTGGREELFQKVCRTLAEEGAFQLAWIGWRDPATERLVPLAAYGAGSDFMMQAQVYADERPEGLGPSGIAFRQERPYLCNDLFADPATRPWREKAVEYGYRSSATFPLRLGGQVMGVLSVYAGEAGYFQDREVAMLAEAAMDISYGLGNLQRETERRAALDLASKEILFSDTVIESMPGILYFYNEKRQFLRWNRNFEEVSGYSGEEIATMSPLDFFAPADRPAVAQRIDEVFEADEAAMEKSFLAKDGTRTPYFFTGHRVVYEGEDCLAGVGIDISQLTRARAELMQMNETLEHTVRERTRELEAMLHRAETSDRLKSAFLATMSHELRTPLNSIIGFTGVLQGGLAGPVNEEQAKQLGMVRGSARHLLELISDVLDLSKIEAGELRVAADPFDLQASLERVQASLAPMARKAGLSLDLKIDSRLGTMVGDRRRVEQIALNLLSNAIKFTSTGGVTLAAEPVPGDPHPAVRIRVTDTGIGIAPEHLSILFQPFRQIDSSLNRAYEGTGLGLAICHRLTGLMGGRIEVNSEPGVGSCFTVILPLGPRGTT